MCNTCIHEYIHLVYSGYFRKTRIDFEIGNSCKIYLDKHFENELHY